MLKHEPLCAISWVALSLIILAATGCATSDQPYNPVTGGYTQTTLAPDIVRIVFRGNSSTSKERVQDLALLRAAELSLAAGFPYFTVRSQNTAMVSVGMTTDEILVQYLKAKIPDALVYDAAFLQRTLKEKYKVADR